MLHPGRIVDYSPTTVQMAAPILRSTMLGKELRQAREKAGMTQEQLAFRARVDRTYISILERDKKSPTVITLLRICRALKVPASQIIARIE
jgi:transcriptional regulator with XRE-family HTH domain